MTTQQATAYLDRVLAGELAELHASNGGRNNSLFRVAARLYAFCEAGAWSYEEMTDRLFTEGVATGLERHEVRTTLRSAERKARALARDDWPYIPDGSSARAIDTTPRAPEPCDPPSSEWAHSAAGFVLWAQAQLEKATGAQAYLAKRGLTEKTIRAAGLGYNPQGRETSRAKWGLPPLDNDDRLWLPPGIVIPSYVGTRLWKVQIRRDVVRKGQDRYYTISGSSNALYNADSIQPGRPAMLVEGPFDALAVQQVAGDVLGVAASGTSGARRVRWFTVLSWASQVLISLDADKAGDDASAYWLGVLGDAKRWRPYYGDPAQMLEDGQDVRTWALAGLGKRAMTFDPIVAEFWREALENNWTEHLARLRDVICPENGADYELTIAALRP